MDMPDDILTASEYDTADPSTGGGRPTDRQVREKLASRGVESLSDAELLSILIREGTAGTSAVDTAGALLESYGNSLSDLAEAGIARLRMARGIGMGRAATLGAAFELAVRLRATGKAAPAVIKTDRDVAVLMGPLVGRLKHEEMWALYLSSANGVIEKNRVSQGGVTSLIIDTKLVVKRAVELLASSVILVHNHPSGLAEPSPEDVEITDRIAEAAALFDITLIDHIIIAGDSSYSFRQHSLIK
jgi:DNA repair protein RadC